MFRLVGKNFWVVTRYNRSRYYAMAVLEFANALRQAREAGLKPELTSARKSGLKQSLQSKPRPSHAEVLKPQAKPQVKAQVKAQTKSQLKSPVNPGTIRSKGNDPPDHRQ